MIVCRTMAIISYGMKAHSLNHKHSDKRHKKWHNSKFIIFLTRLINCLCVYVLSRAYVEKNMFKHTLNRTS